MRTTYVVLFGHIVLPLPSYMHTLFPRVNCIIMTGEREFVKFYRCPNGNLILCVYVTVKQN